MSAIQSNRIGGGIYDPRHLYPYLSRIIEASGLVWCFFENVANHLQVGFDTVYADLQRMGFKVEAGIYTAAEVGASHLRERMFVLAIKEEVLDHAQREGLERYGWYEYCEERRQTQAGPAAEAGIFPAFFGEPQYSWEEPRVLKSRMGSADDGYDYTDDLLRALGNSVVPQTAELAFRDLLQKHINNLK